MLKVKQLSVAFGDTEVVKNISLTVEKGEIVGFVGESGSGKSVTALTIMGLLRDSGRITSGSIEFHGEELASAAQGRNEKRYRQLQGSSMSMVFQEPMTSLNPTQRVGKQVEEVCLLHTDWTREEIRAAVLRTFREVGLRNPEQVYSCYPHQLSGGMRQRVMISMAVILKPDLMIADEPTTALDITIQNQIVALLQEINKKEQNSMIFITHDLNLAKRICHRIVVMKNGEIVEVGKTKEIFEQPKEEYTKKLMAAIPGRIKQQACHSSLEQREPVVAVRDLSVFYETTTGSIFRKKQKICAVSDVSFDIYPGESLGLVGESGCGKTTLSKAILGMNKRIEGSIIHQTAYPQMVFQDPYSSLNPSKTIGWLLMEPLKAQARLLGNDISRKELEEKACEMLRKIGLSEEYFGRRPHELSGGQRQRVSIGQAFIARPKFIIADEPVSALDVTIQAQIMELMQSLQREYEIAVLFISHDIHVVYQMCDRIMVMEKGRLVEIGDTQELFSNPKEEYTRRLLLSSF